MPSQLHPQASMGRAVSFLELDYPGAQCVRSARGRWYLCRFGSMVVRAASVDMGGGREYSYRES